MKETLVSQLKAMKQGHDPLIPRAEFKRITKDRVFSYCRSTVSTERVPITFVEKVQAIIHVFVPNQMMQFARTMASVAIICGVGVGGWIASVSASYQSVPGDALYNVKLATEKVQIVVSEVTQEKTKTAKLHTEFAARRAEEVQRVIEKNKEPEQAKTAMVLLAKSVDQATAAIQQAEADGYDGTDVLESTKQLLSDTERIIFVLQSALDALPPEVIDLVDEIITAQGDLTEKRLNTLEAIITSNIDGRIDLSDEEIIDIIQSSIASLKNRASVNEAITKELTTDTVATSTTTALPSVATTTSAVDVTSSLMTTSTAVQTSTLQLSTSTGATPLAQQMPEAVLTIGEVGAKTTAVQATLVEVDSLIQQGDLIGAIEKAKQANTETSKVEQVVKKASVQTKDQTQSNQDTVPIDTAAETPPNTTPGDNTTSTTATSTKST